jgi:hypothetical protein
MTVGRMPGGFNADAVAAAGAKALQGPEQWTGQNSVFAGKAIPDDEVQYLVLFDSNKTFDRSLTDMRAKHEWLRHDGGGDDLTAELRSLGGSKVSITTIERVQASRAIHFAIHTAVKQALGTFIREQSGNRNARFPASVTEGLNAELQRIIPDGDPRVLWKTVSYENNSGSGSTDWDALLRNAIKEKDKNLEKASEVFEFDLLARPAVQYTQMWSLMRFFVQGAKNKKGDGNKLLLMLQSLASGASSAEAVKSAYRMEDPRLTRTWYQWVVRGR